MDVAAKAFFVVFKLPPEWALSIDTILFHAHDPATYETIREALAIQPLNKPKD